MDENIGDIAVNESFETFLVTVIADSVSGLIALAALFIIFWGAVEVYKKQDFTWRKVLLLSLIAILFVQIFLLVSEPFIVWEVFVYIEAAGMLVSSILFVAAALSFLRLVNHIKST